MSNPPSGFLNFKKIHFTKFLFDVYFMAKMSLKNSLRSEGMLESLFNFAKI